MAAGKELLTATTMRITNAPNKVRPMPLETSPARGPEKMSPA
jgi:hypothetical protein